MPVHTIVNMAATDGSISTSVPTTVSIDKASTTCLAVSECSLISAVPCPQALVNTRVWVFGRLCAGQLLLHAFHTSAERVAAFAALWLWSLQTRFAGVCFVVRGSSLGVQATLLRFAFFPLPCWTLSHLRLSVWIDGCSQEAALQLLLGSYAQMSLDQHEAS